MEAFQISQSSLLANQKQVIFAPATELTSENADVYPLVCLLKQSEWTDI